MRGVLQGVSKPHFCDFVSAVCIGVDDSWQVNQTTSLSKDENKRAKSPRFLRSNLVPLARPRRISTVSHEARGTKIMPKEGACAGPISSAERLLDRNSASDGVGDGDGARGTRRRRNTGAPKRPSKKTRKGGSGDGTTPKVRRREDVMMADTQIDARAQKIFERLHRTWRVWRRKPPDDDGRTKMTLTIRFTETRWKKTDLLRRDGHEGRVAT